MQHLYEIVGYIANRMVTWLMASRDPQRYHNSLRSKETQNAFRIFRWLVSWAKRT